MNNQSSSSNEVQQTIQAQSQPDLITTDQAYLTIVNLSDQIFQKIHKTHVITKDDLKFLHFLFPSILSNALDLVDFDKVTLVREIESGNYFFNVQGTDIFPYCASFNHCSCPAFNNLVVLQQTQSIYCKHQLAARIAMSLGRIKIQELSSGEWKQELTKFAIKQQQQHQQQQTQYDSFQSQHQQTQSGQLNFSANAYYNNHPN